MEIKSFHLLFLKESLNSTCFYHITLTGFPRGFKCYKIAHLCENTVAPGHALITTSHT